MNEVWNTLSTESSVDYLGRALRRSVNNLLEELDVSLEEMADFTGIGLPVLDAMSRLGDSSGLSAADIVGIAELLCVPLDFLIVGNVLDLVDLAAGERGQS